MKPTKLYESLFILHKCSLTINRLWSMIKESEKSIDEIKDFALLFTYYMNMEAVSFLNEFNNGFYHNIEDNYKPRMKDVRKITAPILKRINKWKDLEKFRNNIIAHPWRHNGKFVIPDQHRYNVPRNWFEYGVLANLITYILAMIEAEFKKEMDETFIYMASLLPPEKEPTNYSTLNPDHLKMASEVGEICAKLNKDYHLKVLQYIFEE